MDDPFIQDHDADELDIAGEFLTNWLPYLTRQLCDRCSQTLTDRIRSLRPDASENSDCVEHDRLGADRKASSVNSDSLEPSNYADSDPNLNSTCADATVETNRRETEADSNSSKDLGDESPSGTEHIDQSQTLCSDQDLNFPVPDQLEESPSWSGHIEPSGWGTDPEPDQEPNLKSPKVRMSWADMVQEEDELAEEEERTRENDEVSEGDKKKNKKVELSREQREWIRFKNVRRKKDFICLERVKGKIVNILDGLELHTGVFSAAEQKRIVDFVYELQGKGRRFEFGEHTYSEPQKWMRGKGRVTIQFGCCYNYAMDRDGTPPGILRNVVSDPIPSLFKVIIKRLVRWRVLPTSCTPDSCIVNIYEPGDCIPPHIDSHDFVRPFSTVSFLSECNVLFGSNLKIEGPGEFIGSTAIPLPVGSVLVLAGNGADVAKHCVPAVPSKRISITFRRMDGSKRPAGFDPEPDLRNIWPLSDDSIAPEHQVNTQRRGSRKYDRPHQVVDARSAMGRVREFDRRAYDSEPRSRFRRDDGEEISGRNFEQARHSRGLGPTLNTGRRRVRVVIADD